MVGFRGCIAGLVGVLGALRSGGSAEAPAAALYEIRDSEQLRQAIGADGARTLRLEPGSYVVNEALVIRGQSHVNVIGSGWNTTIARSGAGAADSGALRPPAPRRVALNPGQVSRRESHRLLGRRPTSTRRLAEWLGPRTKAHPRLLHVSSD